MPADIVLHGAPPQPQEDTLRIPKNQLVVLTGLSGSGKSTLAFETPHKEGQRQLRDLGNTVLVIERTPWPGAASHRACSRARRHSPENRPRAASPPDLRAPRPSPRRDARSSG
jgi:excinuclease ABC subunit A